MAELVLSQTAIYALRAMVGVASAEPAGSRVAADQLAARTHVPPAFLSKVLRKLVEAGLLQSTRGHHGGFALARPPDRIRFLDVLEAVDIELSTGTCAFGWGPCDPDAPCPLHPMQIQLRHAVRDWASGHTLADVDLDAYRGGRGPSSDG